MPPATLNIGEQSATKEQLEIYANTRDVDFKQGQDKGVTVTLARTHNSVLDKRTVVVRPEEPVNIGRASKSQVKKLEAAPDNALFDCPVISRTHAELKFHYNEWVGSYEVHLTDTGSMHGTYVNEVKLRNGEAFTLHAGDQIRLGDKVSRGEGRSLLGCASDGELTYAPPDVHNGILIRYDVIDHFSSKTSNLNKGFGVPEVSDYLDSEGDLDYESEEVDMGAPLQDPDNALDALAGASSISGGDKKEQTRARKTPMDVEVDEFSDMFDDDEAMDFREVESIVSEEPSVTKVDKVAFNGSQHNPINLDVTVIGTTDDKPEEVAASPTVKAARQNIFSKDFYGSDDSRAYYNPFADGDSNLPPIFKSAYPAHWEYHNENMSSQGGQHAIEGQPLKTSQVASIATTASDHKLNTLAAGSAACRISTPLATATPVPSGSSKRKAAKISAGGPLDDQMSIHYVLGKNKPPHPTSNTTTRKSSSKWDKKPVQQNDVVASAKDAFCNVTLDPTNTRLDTSTSQQSVTFVEATKEPIEEPPRKKAKVVTGSMVKSVSKEAGKALGLMAVGALGMTWFMATDFAASLIY